MSLGSSFDPAVPDLYLVAIPSFVLLPGLPFLNSVPIIPTHLCDLPSDPAAPSKHWDISRSTEPIE